MKVLIENIVSFQSIEAFEEATSLVYENLSDQELFEALEKWHYPGEHDTNWYDKDHLNTNFLGHQMSHDKKYLLSRYENGLVIGLGYIVDEK